MRTRELVLVAGATAMLVGALRQGNDARAVRRGDRPAVFADNASPVRVPAVFDVPARPTSGFGRAVTFMWGAPLTAVGMMLAVAGGSRPTYDATRGCFVARGVGGVSALLQRRVNADAHTLGHVVLCRSPQPSDALLNHESGHVRQAERFGVTMPVVYSVLTAIHGYANNPFEIAARNFAADRSM